MAKGQYYYYNDDYYDNPLILEIGGTISGMNCLTDLGGHKGIGQKYLKDLNLGKTNLAGGVFLGVLYKYAVGLRAEFTFGHVEGNDNVLYGITDIAKERFNRNLNFRSIIQEGALVAEFHPLYIFIDWPSRDRPPPRFSPYVLGGFGYFHFDPLGNYNGMWIELQPLSTEGEGFAEYPNRKVYKLNQTNIPYGLGVKYDPTPFINLRLEVLARHLHTDYLDDVSTRYIDPKLYFKYFTGTQLQNALIMNDRRLQPRNSTKRGTPSNNDSYFTVGLKLSVVLGRERRQ